jgi:4-hydroxy-tetrahydrodipicolinate synthase
MTASIDNRMHGIWPALLTPLQADGSIDHARFVAHGRALLATGCGGLTPFGTTGEGPSFSVTERIAAVDALIAGGVPARQLLVSTSACALTDVIALTRHAVAAGCWGTMLMPPFFFKGLSDEGIVAAYEQVIAASGATPERPLRLMLYHIPQVAGVGLNHAIIATLLQRHGDVIVGIKDSQCELAHSLSLVEAFMPGMTVHVGNEPDLPALGRLGSTGAVSGLANFWPRTVHRLVSQPDAPGTAADLTRVQVLLGALGGYALIAALKGIVAQRDGEPAWLRMRAPLVALDADGLARLQASLAAIGFDVHTD